MLSRLFYYLRQIIGSGHGQGFGVSRPRATLTWIYLVKGIDAAIVAAAFTAVAFVVTKDKFGAPLLQKSDNVLEGRNHDPSCFPNVRWGLFAKVSLRVRAKHEKPGPVRFFWLPLTKLDR
jgi:hypothetical protein